MLIKQLVWEGLNAPTHSIITVFCNEGIQKSVLVIRNLDPINSPITVLPSSLVSLLSDRQRADDIVKGSQVDRFC